MNNRVKNLISKMNSEGIDVALIGSAYNREYLSGFTGSNATLFITKDKQIIITDFRYLEQVSIQCPDFTVVDQAPIGMQATILKLIGEEKANKADLKVAIEGDHVTVNEYEKLKDSANIVSTSGLIEEFRQIKDDNELENLAKAEAIGDIAFKEIVPFIEAHWHDGLTEAEIALEIECIMRRNGATGTSFDTIVAAGAKSSLPHAVPDNSKVKKGDFIVMDFGCRYNGYCSDMTRTVVVGEASEKHKEIYNTVLKAQLAALAGAKVGMLGKEVDKIARDIIKDAGYGDKFGHGLGHSVGVEIHEEPRFSVADENVIKEGMVITVEPGIYEPGFGGVRIEDMVVMTKDGVKNLTHSPKELIVIP